MLDIGGSLKGTCGDAMAKFVYQKFLILLFLCGEPFGGALLRGVFGKASPRKTEEIRAQMGYPYFYAFYESITCKSNSQMKNGWMPDTTNMPILFIYGSKKAFYFHDKTWLEFLDNNKDNGCRFKEYDCDHWISTEKSDDLNKDLLQWFEETQKN